MIKFYFTIKDLILILLLSKWSSKKHFLTDRSSKKLRILGNGNSLADVEFIKDDNTDYMVVNRHVVADNYNEIRPRYYVLADPYFFSNNEGLEILHKINEKTSWEMTVFVPFSRKRAKKWKEIFKNKSINVVTYNDINFRGYKTIAYYLYKLQMSMPQVQNVLVAAIMIGLIMRYGSIELFGVEHSWTKYLYVGEDNLVYLENPHFYDKEKVNPLPYRDLQHVDEYPMWFALECFMKMFKSYSIIKDYIEKEGIKTHIVNKTPGSFIDVFDRR